MQSERWFHGISLNGSENHPAQFSKEFIKRYVCIHEQVGQVQNA